MDYSQPFSALNERLKPRFSSEQLYSSLSRLEDRKMGSLRSKAASAKATVLPTEPEPALSVGEPEDRQEPETEEQLRSGSDVGNLSDLISFASSRRISDFSLKDDEEEEEDGELSNDNCSTTHSEETDSTGELASERLEAGAGPGSYRRFDLDKTLPDLIKSGRPLGRRRTLGHVSDTLKEVRREVELSRRRSIRLKAQVDKLQESNDGPGWSHHRERVTEEILSVLRLLQPLVEPEPSGGEHHLDAALFELKNVARKLALSHTKQDGEAGKRGAEDSAILQQALRDRDEAIEKKKAMEDEVLQSKTEMMVLNNQLLEGAQKRLELSLELEAWKEDFQRLLQQTLQTQQEAEQAQNKSRKGLLRRNKPPVQRPTSYQQQPAAPPTTNTNQIFISKSATLTHPPTKSPPPAGATRTWRDKLKKSRPRVGEQGEAGRENIFSNDGFQNVSLD